MPSVVAPNDGHLFVEIINTSDSDMSCQADCGPTAKEESSEEQESSEDHTQADLFGSDELEEYDNTADLALLRKHAGTAIPPPAVSSVNPVEGAQPTGLL